MIWNLLEQLESALFAAEMNTPAPSAEALASVEPFCVDTMTFSAWLQWVYLPKMRQAYQLKRLPAQSGLLPIAEEAWRGCSNVKDLLHLVAQLDTAINHRSLN